MLPSSEEPIADAETVVDPDVLAVRRARRAERAHEGAAALERRLAEAETRLAHAEAERERLTGRLAEVERELDAARAGRRAAEGEARGLRDALVEVQARAAGLEAELQALRASLAEDAGGEDAGAEGIGARFAAMEERLDALRDELTGVAGALRARLEAEQAARRAAEDQLAAERGRRAEAEMELARLRERPAPRPPLAPADVDPGHPALARAAAGDGDGAGDAVVGDLTRAWERLRAGAGAARIELPARRATVGGSGAWLTPALAALAGDDPEAALRVLLAATPVQLARLGAELTYDLAVDGLGTHRVALAPAWGAAVVRLSDGEPRKGAAFRLAGPVQALAPLAGGGTRRRLDGVTASGRRRPRRRLLRALREPLGLEALGATGAAVGARDLLALVAHAPGAGDGPADAVAVAFAGDAERLPALVAPGGGGALRATELPAEEADAVVDGGAAGLLAVLLGTGPIVVTGDADAARTVLDRLDAAQGLRP